MWRSRSFWAAVLAVAYTAFAALRAGDALPWAALFGLPVVLWHVWRGTASPTEPPASNGESAAAARATAAGAAVLLASRAGAEASLLTALGNAGAMVASIGALWALSRLPGRGHLLPEESAARRLDAAAFASLFWTVAVALPAVRALSSERMIGLDPLADDYATVTASVGSMGVSLVALVRARVARRLLLGAAERTNAALSLALLALIVGVTIAASGVSPPHAVLPAASTGAAVAIAWSAVTKAPAALGSVLRVTAMIVGGCAPVAVAAVYMTHARPGRAGLAVLLACALCALVGLASSLLDRRLARGPRARVHALASAGQSARFTDPDEAIEEVLRTLSRNAKDGVRWLSPILFRLFPAESMAVDRAGYGHVEPAELPSDLVKLAALEPEGVLRAEVLRAAAVRRPEVRPLLAWLDDRYVEAVVILREGEDPIAVLALPFTDRASPMGLDEVLAVRALADRIAGTVAVSAALARSRARELSARERADAESAEAERLAHVIDHQAGRLRAVAEMLARPARVAAYSPAARTALDEIERLGESGKPVTLLLAPGLDPIPWAAVAHLASERRDGALVIAEGVGNRELYDVAHWRDPARSLLGAARGGTLVLLDAHALPLEVQRYVAVAAGPDVGLIVASFATIDVLVGQGRLDEHLADRFGDRAVALPPLSARAEDLRGLLLDRLARIGERLRGKPMGLAPAALAALTEHTWPGNDAEMDAILVRASLAEEGDVVGLVALRAAGFEAQEASTDVAPRALAKRPRQKERHRKAVRG